MSCSAWTMPTIGPCHGSPAAVDRVGAEHGALVDDHDLHPTPAGAGAPTRARSAPPRRGRSGRPSRPRARARASFAPWRRSRRRARRRPRTRPSRRSQSGASPVAASTMLRRQEREFGPLLVAEQPLNAEVELVVAEARRVQPPGVLHVDGGHVVQQRRVGRRGADVVAGRQQQRVPGQRRAPPRRTASPAAARRRRGTLSPSRSVVVGSSWPWKSFSATMDSGVYRAAPQHIAPHGALAVLRRGDAEQEGRRRREVDAAHAARLAAADRATAGEKRGAHVRVRRRGPARRAHSRAGRRTPSGRSACRAWPRRTGRAARRRPRGRRCGSGAPCRRCCPRRSGYSAPRPWCRPGRSRPSPRAAPSPVQSFGSSSARKAALICRTVAASSAAATCWKACPRAGSRPARLR